MLPIYTPSSTPMEVFASLQGGGTRPAPRGYPARMTRVLPLLRFRCTGCGNCCKDPLLPITDCDLHRIVEYTNLPVGDLVRWVDRHGIDLPGEPESFVRLRAGRRVMVLRHEHGHCRFLADDNRCKIYLARPHGCRIFPLTRTSIEMGDWCGSD